MFAAVGLSMPFMMKVMVWWYFVSDPRKIMTALIPVVFVWFDFNWHNSNLIVLFWSFLQSHQCICCYWLSEGWGKPLCELLQVAVKVSWRQWWSSVPTLCHLSYCIWGNCVAIFWNFGYMFQMSYLWYRIAAAHWHSWWSTWACYTTRFLLWSGILIQPKLVRSE
jgi:hypothetical protein